MTDLLSVFENLRRPKTLILAARIGSSEYRREKDLKRLLRLNASPTPGSGLSRLMALEQDLEATRKNGDATYRITKHVEILAALLAEAALLQRRKIV